MPSSLIVQWQNGLPVTVYPDGLGDCEADLAEELRRSAARYRSLHFPGAGKVGGRNA